MRLHAVAVLLLLMGLATAPVSAADVQLVVTSPGTNVMGGVYVNPYVGTVAGVKTQLICDDFSDHSPIGLPGWTATEYTLGQILSSNLDTQVMKSGGFDQRAADAGWDQNTKQQARNDNYEAVALLAVQLLSASNNTTRGQISFALWSVFTPSAMDKLNGTSNLAGAQWYLNDALAMAKNVDFFSNASYSALLNNVHVYIPTAANSTVQEMVTVSMPEASASTLFLFDFVAIAGAILWFRRRGLRSNGNV